MKSQRIRVRNLPQDATFFEKTIHVKPIVGIVALLIAGGVLLFLKPYLALTGVTMMLLAVFCIVIMPDRNLCSFSKDYMVLYNQHDRDYCTIVYWDEIVSWQYEWHNTYDQLVIALVDGSTEIQELYSFRSVKKYMMAHAGNKMKKAIRVRKESV